MPIAWSNGCNKLAAITAFPVPEPYSHHIDNNLKNEFALLNLINK